MPTKQQINAAIKVALAIADAVKAAGPDGIPAGHVYAAALNAFSSVEQFEGCIRLLVNQGLVERRGDLLVSLV